MGSKKSIGKVLKIARHATNMTLMEASLVSGVSLPYISDLERQRKSNISVEILEKLAKVYDLQLFQMIELEVYYSNLDLPEERKFRLTLMKALEMMESNHKNN